MNRVGLTIGTLSLCVSVACSVETPNVNGTTGPVGPVGTVPPGTYGAGVGMPGAPFAGPYCKLDTRQIVELQGRFLEVVTSRGRLFEMENGMPVQPGVGIPGPNGAVDLTTVPLYAAGPCAGRAPGTCVFDTHAFVLLPPNRLVEYVTTMGRQFVFEANQMTGAGVELAAIPRYQDLCANRAMTGGLCKLDTRTFAKIGNDVIESITAYGRRWQYNLDGMRLPDSGVDLATIPHYAAGPCMGRAPGQCIFETRAYEVIGGQLTESITANGMVWRFNALTNAPVQPGTPIMSTPHWANGPCR